MVNPPGGTVTFLFTDIEGSTRLSQEFPDSLHTALDRHHAILEKSITSNNGFVFDIVGDAFCCAFENTEDAVKSAVEIQTRLSEERWDKAVIKIRIGIHSGKAEWNGNTYMGYITLARSARVMSAAYGEQILISEDAFALLKNPHALRGNGDENISFRDLGERRLKDVIQPIRLYQITAQGLREDFPPLKTLDARANNLPIQLTSFIGRDSIIRELKDELKKSRLITIIGTGGNGKTRTALQTGAEIIDEFANGVFIAELAPITDESLIVQSVMNSLGIKEEAGKSPEEALVNYLKEKEMLIILDNCEHLIKSSAVLAEKILKNCSGIKIIATSREALNCRGELVYKLPALSVPDLSDKNSPEKLSQYESVRLFIERALMLRSDFRVTNENAPALAGICSRLDGIPLAIELAAARTKLLSVEKIHERLDDMFKLLSGGKRTDMPKQQTLKAMIDWSHNLLSEKEKTFWARLSIYSGGWTLESCEEICSDSVIEEAEILDLLAQLTEKSIVIYDESRERYKMLETIREYGKSKLMESGEYLKYTENHLKYFSSFAKQASFRGDEAKTRINKISPEHNNLIAAIESFTKGTQKELCAGIADSLRIFWEIKGDYSTGLRLMEILFADTEGISKKNLANLYLNYSSFSRSVGSYENSRKYGIKGMELNFETGEAMGKILSLQNMGNIEAVSGNFDEAEKYFEQGLALSRESDFISGIAFALNNIGNIWLLRGDYEKAERYLNESLEYHNKSGDKRNVCFALDSLGNMMKERGEFEKSREYLTKCLEISREIGDKSGIAFTCFNLAGLYFSMGEHEKAQMFNEESLKLRLEIGDKPGIAYSLNNIAMTLFIRKKYEQAEIYHKKSLKMRLELGDKHAILLSFESFLHLFEIKKNFISAARLLGVIDSSFKKLGLLKNIEETEALNNTKNNVKEMLGEEAFMKHYSEGLEMQTEITADMILNDEF